MGPEPHGVPSGARAATRTDTPQPGCFSVCRLLDLKAPQQADAAEAHDHGEPPDCAVQVFVLSVYV
ncbi:hypothetical protein IscW_ISCW014249 [Ixodes scapularis]|uniref:Uncharacterized protein n=1 Tax=Ixodes scapularis TaxID=6945 RepID=B7QLU4_IXOSC|nr:hypothetical protein IscW_ISCW014249 [Ixodes scapularis]|eukprot:XP_002416149.1 hypothetical protein IscW_ISCW014249 [Ixodes scapularis]